MPFSWVWVSLRVMRLDHVEEGWATRRRSPYRPAPGGSLLEGSSFRSLGQASWPASIEAGVAVTSDFARARLGTGASVPMGDCANIVRRWAGAVHLDESPRFECPPHV